MKKMLRGERRQDAMLEGDSKFCGVAAAMIGSAVVGAGASAYSAKKNASAASAGSNQSGTQEGTSSTALDPRIAQLLGMNGGGILGNLGGLMSNGGSSLAGQSNSFLNSNAGQILNNGKAGTDALMSGYQAPTIQGAQVQAPSQNGINLSPTFQSLLGGGDTSALMKSLQAGNALAGAQFQQNQQNLTDNLQRNVMPGIRGGAIAAGQYGGSRQGIAEGLAISDLTKQLNNSNTQFGLGATAANSSALAGAYENGQNRALSAAQGLSGQQYGVASQDAAARQAADNTNVQALLATRGQNSNNLATGIGLQQGLLGSAANMGNADLSRLGMQSGILAPFLGAGATTTTKNETTGNVSQPLYSNTAGAAIGGGLAGLQLGSSMYNMFGSGATDWNAIRNSNGSGTPTSAGSYHYAPSQMPVRTFG